MWIQYMLDVMYADFIRESELYTYADFIKMNTIKYSLQMELTDA